MCTSLRVTATLVIITAARGLAAAQGTPADRAADAAAIRAHIESICQAFVDKDRAKLEATHGKDWRGFTVSSGHVIRGRDAYMNEATFPPGLPKNQGMVGYRISDFDVVFYGDTAVASFVLDADYAFGGEKTTRMLTLLDVYNKGPQGWIQVASNTSLHPDEVDRMASQLRPLDNEERGSLMKAREGVWRAWFAGDTDSLGTVLPPELITLEAGTGAFGTRTSTLDGSRGFAARGGKLTRLAFPRTEIQTYGNTAVMYSSYEMDLQSGGTTTPQRGAAVEVFVKQNGRWLNTGWQLAPIRP
jgi:uncharacterized protein DUF4440